MQFKKKGNLHCQWKFEQPLWNSVWRFHKELKEGIPFDSAVPLLGNFPKVLNLSYCRDTYAYSSTVHNSKAVETVTVHAYQQINE